MRLLAVVWPEFQRTDLGWAGVAVELGGLVVLFLGKRMVGREMGKTALAPQRLERRRDGF